MPDSIATSVTALDVVKLRLHTERRPADAGYIARKVMSLDWPKWTGAPCPPTHSYAWLIEACRAELAWSHADYCRITGEATLAHDAQYDGGHRSQMWRLPVEQMAAKVLNIHGHVHVSTAAIRQAIKGVRDRRHRFPHLEIGAPWEIEHYWPMRRQVWPLFVQAAREYRRARAAIDTAAIGRAA